MLVILLQGLFVVLEHTETNYNIFNSNNNNSTMTKIINEQNLSTEAILMSVMCQKLIKGNFNPLLKYIIKMIKTINISGICIKEESHLNLYQTAAVCLSALHLFTIMWDRDQCLAQVPAVEVWVQVVLFHPRRSLLHMLKNITGKTEWPRIAITLCLKANQESWILVSILRTYTFSFLLLIQHLEDQNQSMIRGRN